MSSCPRILLVPVSLLAICVCACRSVSWAQASHSEQVQIKPPMLRMTDPPAPDATAAELEARADQLRAREALSGCARLLSRGAGQATELGGAVEQDGHHRVDDAALSRGEEVVRASDQSRPHSLPTPTTIWAWCITKSRKYGAAVKEYRRAIAIDGEFGVVLQQSGRGAFRQEGI